MCIYIIIYIYIIYICVLFCHILMFSDSQQAIRLCPTFIIVVLASIASTYVARMPLSDSSRKIAGKRHCWEKGMKSGTS
jgi:hypothetical protein